MLIVYLMGLVKKMTEYWIVYIEWSQTDSKYVLVDATTGEDAVAVIRNNGCNARYIKALSKANVVGKVSK